MAFPLTYRKATVVISRRVTDLLRQRTANRRRRSGPKARRRVVEAVLDRSGLVAKPMPRCAERVSLYLAITCILPPCALRSLLSCLRSPEDDRHRLPWRSWSAHSSGLWPLRTPLAAEPSAARAWVHRPARVRQLRVAQATTRFAGRSLAKASLSCSWSSALHGCTITIVKLVKAKASSRRMADDLARQARFTGTHGLENYARRSKKGLMRALLVMLRARHDMVAPCRLCPISLVLRASWALVPSRSRYARWARWLIHLRRDRSNAGLRDASLGDHRRRRRVKHLPYLRWSPSPASPTSPTTSFKASGSRIAVFDNAELLCALASGRRGRNEICKSVTIANALAGDLS